ncbi:MAG: hypothetical protein JNK37_10000 [Verrucomicrobiales bacterium]|nr:hypothetical protein [Verrucomicrobiales bacterium]
MSPLFAKSDSHRPFLAALGLFSMWATVAGLAQEPAPVTAESAVTATAGKKARQIRVTAEDPTTRTAFANFADGLRAEFGALFGENDEVWVYPVDLRVSGAPKDVVEGRTAVIPPIELLPDGRFQLQLAVRLHNRYDGGEVRRELLRLLLYEMMLRPYASDPARFSGEALAVPPWLLRGLDELLRHRASGRPSDLYAGLVKSRNALSVSQILDQADVTLDPVTDAVFAASSAALLSALLDQDGGQQSIRSFLGSLPDRTKPDQGVLLREHFPGLRGSPAALEKWWSLELATMGQLQAVEFYSLKETEELLDQALSIVLPAGKAKPVDGIRRFLPQGKPDEAFTGRLHDYEQFLEHHAARAALESRVLELKTLNLRAFPLLRSLILRYELAASRLLAGKARGVAADLKQIDEERVAIRSTMERVDDYLNFYEATQAEGRSEAYDHYRQIREKLERQGRPERKDRISTYLDALEAEFAPVP